MANNRIITLFDTNEKLCIAWENEFSGVRNVRVLNEELRSIPRHDCLVTAGNSFAIMDGGIDLAVRNMMGIHVQDKIQWEAVGRYGGQIPVGMSICVETSNPTFPFLLYAPTMITPMRIHPHTIYHVFLGVLNSTKGAESIACCGLGSRTGQVRPADVARHMKAAFVSYTNLLEMGSD